MFEAFQVGPFILWTQIVFLLLGIWLSVEFFLRLALSAHFSLQQFQQYRWWYLVAFLFVGRIGAMVMNYRAYVKDPLRVLIVWDGNFSFIGGILGVAAVLWYVNRTSRSTFLQWLDVLLPAATFGMTFDWVGKFFAGQSYGRPTDMFWGVTYDAMHVRYVIPVHPVQLYYAAFFLLLTFLLLVVRKNAKRSGSETLVGIVLAALGTCFFEQFRGDFSILVFPTYLDFLLLLLLFVGLGVFALVEVRLPPRAIIGYELSMAALFGGYIFARAWWFPFSTFELRFSQLLAVLALLATVVYVVVHRQRHPHL